MNHSLRLGASMVSSFRLTPQIKLYVFLCAVFVSALLVGDIIGGKLVEVELFNYPFVISVGMLAFPVTFVLTDVINEFYGKQAARFITFVAFFVALVAFLTIFVAALLPFAPFTYNSDWTGITKTSFDNVFTGSQRILASSLVAFMFSQFIDIAVFHAIKKYTKDRFLFLRATGSTLASQLVDTFVIQFLVWWGVLPLSKIFSLVVTGYTIKFLVAVGLTPVLYALHTLIEKTILKNEVEER
jgi:queuosine precursor transporter